VECLIEASNENDTSPLMRAAQEGHVSVVKLLLKHGADGDRRNKFGLTPLMFAAQSGHVDVCRYLIEHDADYLFFAYRTNLNSTALSLACKRGHVDVVKELVSLGCDLFEKDNNRRTVQQMMYRRMQRLHDIPEALRPDPKQIKNRQRTDARRRMRIGQDMEDEDNEEGDHWKFVPMESYQKIIHVLNPHIQVELEQSLARVKRNLEIIRIHTLIQRNRASLEIMDGITYSVPTIVQWMDKASNDCKNSDSIMAASSLSENSMEDKLDSYVSELPSCDQMLLRTMLLPTSLVQTISQFLPNPMQYISRMDRLEHYIVEADPTAAIVLTLDLIDEVLEEVGFLSACDTAHIPAPVPHKSWCDWKRSAKPRALYDRMEDEMREQLNENQPPRVSVTTCLPPSPRDNSYPTKLELRRLVGYISILSKYQSSTNIVCVLTEEPYSIPRRIIDQLIRIADIASVSRRCDESQDIRFGRHVALDLMQLADDLYFYM
jgi:hypothetical protein